MTKVVQPEDMDGVSLAHQKEGEKGKKPSAKSCSDWLTRTLMTPSPLMSAAAKEPGKGVFPITKAIMRTTSGTLMVPSPLASPRMNAGLGGAVNEGGGGQGGDGGEGGKGGGKGAEQIGGPARNSALFGGVQSRSGLLAILLQKHTSSLKSR